MLHTIFEHPGPYPPLTVQAMRLEASLFRGAPLQCLQAVADGVERATRWGMCEAAAGYALQLPPTYDGDGGPGGDAEVILYADRHHSATATAVLRRDQDGTLTETGHPRMPHHAELFHALQVIAASARTQPCPGRTR